MPFKDVEEYYILGNKISIKKNNNIINYEVEETNLKPDEEKIARGISDRDNIYKYNLEPSVADKILYYLKRQKFGKLTIPILDDRVREISYFGIKMPLYLYLEGYGLARSNIVYNTREELLNDIKHIFEDRGIRRKGQLIFEDEKMSIICNVDSADNLVFNLIKKRSYTKSIIELIANKLISVHQASFLWELIEKRAFILFVGNDNIYSKVVLSLLNLLSDYKILNITKTFNLIPANDTYIRIPFDAVHISDISLYNPDLIIAEINSHLDILELIKLNLDNKGIIGFTAFPDYYSLLRYLGKAKLLSLSRLPTVIVEILNNGTNIYELTSRKTRIKILKIANSSRLLTNYNKLNVFNKLVMDDIKEKYLFLDNLLQENIMDSSIIYNKIKEKRGSKNNAVAYA